MTSSNSNDNQVAISSCGSGRCSAVSAVALLPSLFSGEFDREWDAQRLNASSPSIDAETLDSLTDLAGDDPDFLMDLLSTYCSQADELFEQARAAAREGRPRDLARAVHALNGSSRNMAAAGVARLCAAMENDIRNGADVVTLRVSVERLQSPLDEARTALHQQLFPDLERCEA